MRQKGFSVTELIMVLALAAMMLMVAVPGFASVLRQSRLNGAVRTLMNDVREARAEATTTGWEYQIVGYGAGGGARANQYRMRGRRTSGAGWPAESAAPFVSATQAAGAWIDIGYLYNGVRLEPHNGAGTPRFELTFDARGAAVMTNQSFDPFQVANELDSVVSLRVSAAGVIRTE